VQLRLAGFDRTALVTLGARVRDLYAYGQPSAERLATLVDDDYLALLADQVTGTLGGKVGIAPRLYLRKLVGDVLDRVDQFEDFDPRRDYSLTVVDADLTDVERNARADTSPTSPDDIDLDLDPPA
jgi:hypothetical protein